MKRYLLIPLVLINVSTFAQSYKAQIDTFRKHYEADFLTDQHSPLKKEDLQNLRYYDADSTYRVVAKADLVPGEPVFTMPDFNGRGRQNTRYATVSFVLKGKPLQLTIYRDPTLSAIPKYKDYLFLPFTDDTNGSTTYGGGRYIDLSAADFKGNTIIIDFNKAYNPYCAFAGGYSCPKPPDENRLAIAIEAGEKQFAVQKKH